MNFFAGLLFAVSAFTSTAQALTPLSEYSGTLIVSPQGQANTTLPVPFDKSGIYRYAFRFDDPNAYLNYINSVLVFTFFVYEVGAPPGEYYYVDENYYFFPHKIVSSNNSVRFDINVDTFQDRIFSPGKRIFGVPTGSGALFQGAPGTRSEYSLSVGRVPEPASWAMLIGGFGLTGAVMRRRRSTSMPPRQWFWR